MREKLNEIIVKAVSRSLLSGTRLSNVATLALHASLFPGDLIEIGVLRGGVSAMLAEICKDRTVHACDTFSGHPEEITEHDNQAGHHAKGRYALSEEELQETLGFLGKSPNIRVHKGAFPESFSEDCSFCFAHIDVDTYLGTKACLEFLWPRLVNQGIMVCDDYAHPGCEGAFTAVNEFVEKSGAILLSGAEEYNYSCVLVKNDGA
jgi:O-methyltransferase